MKKLDKKTTALIRRRFNKGKSINSIAKDLEIAYSTAFGYTRKKKGKFISPVEYNLNLIKKRDFKSMYDYRVFRAIERGYGKGEKTINPYTEYQYALAEINNFADHTHYLKSLLPPEFKGSLYKYHLAKLKAQGYTQNEYLKNRLKIRGINRHIFYLELRIKKMNEKRIEQGKKPFNSVKDYLDHWARGLGMGYKDHNDYQKDLPMRKLGISIKDYRDKVLAPKHDCKNYSELQKKQYAEKQKRPLNQKFSSFLNKSLKEIGMKPVELARRVGYTEAAISRIRHGKTLPKRSHIEEFFEVFGLPYKTLEQFVAEYP